MYIDAYLHWFCAEHYVQIQTPKPVHSSLYRTGTHLLSISKLWSYKSYECLQISTIETLKRSDFPVKNPRVVLDFSPTEPDKTRPE